MSAVEARNRKQTGYNFSCAITYGTREKEMCVITLSDPVVSFNKKHFTHLDSKASVRTGGLYKSREIFVALASCLLSALSPIPALPLLWPLLLPLPLPLPMTGEQHFLFTKMKHKNVLPVIVDPSFQSQHKCFINNDTEKYTTVYWENYHH
jgi:hypothetical protein